MGLVGDMMRQLLPSVPSKVPPAVGPQQPPVDFVLQDLQQRVLALEQAMDSVLRGLENDMAYAESPNDTSQDVSPQQSQS